MREVHGSELASGDRDRTTLVLSGAEVAACLPLEAEPGLIVAGIHHGRQRPDERILVVLVGLGAHAVHVAGYVYRRAVERGVGQWVCLD